MNEKIKVLKIDGNWNLRRNFYSNHLTDSNGKPCGGVYGFLKSLNKSLNKILPDRVIVSWDGFHAGKLRYDIYKPYKANRNKKWEDENRMLENEGMSMDEDERERFELFRQKMVIMNMLEDLFIRQIEVDYIEADDLIAGYVLKSDREERSEEIIIFSRDKDYKQLISDKVSIMTPDSINLITKKNFKEKNGYIIDNELLIRCFEGDKSDCIDGVKGINQNTLLKLFPDISDRKYTYQELSDRCSEQKKKSKTQEKIIEARNILYRNAVLMNLKKPFLNEEAELEIDKISHLPLDENRDIKSLMARLGEDGYIDLLKKDNIDIGSFFAPFYRLQSKEVEYRNSLF